MAREEERVAVRKRNDCCAKEDQQQPQPERLRNAPDQGGVLVQREDDHGNGGDNGVYEQVPGIRGQPISVHAGAADELREGMTMG